MPRPWSQRVISRSSSLTLYVVFIDGIVTGTREKRI
jgi:hypothetical protein